MMTVKGLKWFAMATFFLSMVYGLSAQTPQITGVGSEERIGVFGGTRLSIATDSKNLPHVVADSGMSKSMCLFDKMGTTWKSGVFDLGAYNSSSASIFNPRVEIDIVNDRAWYAAPAFTRRVPSGCGLVLLIRNNISTVPTAPYFSINRAISPIDWEPGTISLDPARPGECIGYSWNGFWTRFKYTGTAPSMQSRIQNDQMFAGYGGEKNAFRISNAGNYAHRSTGSHAVWHAAIHGYHAWDSTYQNSVRAEQGAAPVVFAAYSRYSIMGGDMAYPNVCPDGKDPLSAYIASDFGGDGGICVNIWNASLGRMMYPINANKTIDAAGTSGQPRYGAQMAPAKGGGAFLCWTRDGRVKIRSMMLDGTLGEERDVCAGNYASICTDSEGNLHLVYNLDGSNMAYRKLQVLGAGSAPTLTVGDFNGDHIADLIWHNFASNTVSIRTLDTEGERTSTINIDGASNWTVRCVADVNTNGVGDLVWQHTSGSVYTWFMNANGTMQSGEDTLTGNNIWQPCGTGDLDGDNVPDIFWQLPTGQVCAWIMNPNGTRKQGISIYDSALAWRVCGVGDIDGDRIADIVWQYPTGQVCIWLMNSNGTKKGGLWTFTGTMEWQLRGVGDINGDGIPDMVFHHPSRDNLACWTLSASGQRVTGFYMAQ